MTSVTLPCTRTAIFKSLRRVADVSSATPSSQGFTQMLVVSNMIVFIAHLILFIKFYLVQLLIPEGSWKHFSLLLHLICKISMETLFAARTLEASPVKWQIGAWQLFSFANIFAWARKPTCMAAKYSWNSPRHAKATALKQWGGSYTFPGQSGVRLDLCLEIAGSAICTRGNVLAPGHDPLIIRWTDDATARWESTAAGRSGVWIGNAWLMSNGRDEKSNASRRN